MAKKERVPYLTSYYYYDARSDRRISWFFPSRKEARNWLEWRCKAYIENPILERYLADKPDSSRVRETMTWTAHRDRYRNYKLCTAPIYPRHYKQRREDNDN